MSDRASGSRKDPKLGAAVLKALLIQRRGENSQQALALYEGVLRDLKLTDAEVDAYLKEHQDEVAQAIRSHGRRG